MFVGLKVGEAVGDSVAQVTAQWIPTHALSPPFSAQAPLHLSMAQLTNPLHGTATQTPVSLIV